MSGVITHILRDKPNVMVKRSWCGREKLPFQFYYLTIDHATEDQAAKGRLLPCRVCVKLIIATLISQL